MKVMFGLLVVVAALGVWGGLQAWHLPSFGMRIQGASAILIGVNLLLMTWLWNRTSRTADATLVPYLSFALLSVGMLVNVLPGLVWPAQETLAIGASGVSIVLSAVAVILLLRWNRRVWASCLINT
jgi:hypothetical protein